MQKNNTGIANAQIYVCQKPEGKPSWVDYLKIEESVSYKTCKCIVLFPITINKATRIFALTFGYSFHDLNHDNLDWEFYLRVALNSLAKEGLKSIDSTNTELANQQRIQSSDISSLIELNYDENADILKSITGVTEEEYKTDMGSRISAGSSLQINPKKPIEDMPAFCKKLLAIYNKSDYKSKFPEIGNIELIRDPSLIRTLEGNLVNLLNEQFSTGKDTGVSVMLGEIVDYNQAIEFSFGYKTRIEKDTHTFLLLSDLNSYLKNQIKLSAISLDDIKNISIHLTDPDENPQRPKKMALMSNLVCETNIKGQKYYLDGGKWYHINSNFLNNISRAIDDICTPTELPKYTLDGSNEGEYNKSACKENQNRLCLDKDNLHIKGYPIEACDIFEKKEEELIFHCVKISTRSSSLSHLFNQGYNAVRLIKIDLEIREKFIKKITDAINNQTGKTIAVPNLEKGNYSYKVIFHIITDKPSSKKSKNLPLFSRVSLYRVIQSFKLMGVKVELAFIEKVSA